MYSSAPSASLSMTCSHYQGTEIVAMIITGKIDGIIHGGRAPHLTGGQHCRLTVLFLSNTHSR